MVKRKSSVYLILIRGYEMYAIWLKGGVGSILSPVKGGVGCILSGLGRSRAYFSE